MATSSEDLSKHYEELIYGTPSSSTPSPASAVGLSPSSSPAGPKTEKSGPAPAPASRSRRRGEAKAKKTPDIFGPSSYVSSPSGDLQRSLESRLRARLDVNGSLEYELTWKRWAIGSGQSICALRASARRISDNDYIGWPTCRAIDGTKGQRTLEGVERERERKGGQPPDELPSVVMLAGWTTAQCHDTNPRGVGNRENPNGGGACLAWDAKLAGWPTTAAQNGEKAGMPPETREGHHIGLQDAVRGVILESFLVPTGRRVVLAPEFSLWLMGFPEAWMLAAPGVKDWLEAQAALALEYSKEAGTPSSPSLPPSS